VSDAAEKKKPGLALVISMGKGKKDGDEPDGDESDDKDEGDYGDEFRATCEELADTLGLDDDKHDAFCEQLHACIVAAK
jgi:hypothetical protein